MDEICLSIKNQDKWMCWDLSSPLHIVPCRVPVVPLQSILLLTRVEDSHLLAHVNYLCIPAPVVIISQKGARTYFDCGVFDEPQSSKLSLEKGQRTAAQIFCVIFLDPRFEYEKKFGPVLLRLPQFHLNKWELSAKLLLKRLATVISKKQFIPGLG